MYQTIKCIAIYNYISGVLNSVHKINLKFKSSQDSYLSFFYRVISPEFQIQNQISREKKESEDKVFYLGKVEEGIKALILSYGWLKKEQRKTARGSRKDQRTWSSYFEKRKGPEQLVFFHCQFIKGIQWLLPSPNMTCGSHVSPLWLAYK